MIKTLAIPMERYWDDNNCEERCSGLTKERHLSSTSLDSESPHGFPLSSARPCGILSTAETLCVVVYGNYPQLLRAEWAMHCSTSCLQHWPLCKPLGCRPGSSCMRPILAVLVVLWNGVDRIPSENAALIGQCYYLYVKRQYRTNGGRNVQVSSLYWQQPCDGCSLLERCHLLYAKSNYYLTEFSLWFSC